MIATLCLPVSALAGPTEPDHPAGTVLEPLDQPGTWTVRSDVHPWPQIRAEGIEVDDQGSVWLSSWAFCTDDAAVEPVSCVWRPGVAGYDHHPVREADDTWGEPGLEDFAVTPEGEAWAASYKGLEAFEGSSWVNHTTRGVAEVEVGPDGRLWAAGADAELPPFLASILDDEPAVFYGGDPARFIDTWNQSDVRFLPFDIEATEDGAVWVSGVDTMAPDETWDGFLVRVDGTDWETVTPVAAEERFAVFSLAAGPDGSLWALVAGDSNTYLARHDGTAWSSISKSDGLPSEAWGALEVGLGGAVWLAKEEGGVASFDGNTWTHFLDGAPVHDIAIAPDGAVWAVGEGLFVIRP